MAALLIQSAFTSHPCSVETRVHPSIVSLRLLGFSRWPHSLAQRSAEPSDGEVSIQHDSSKVNRSCSKAVPEIVTNESPCGYRTTCLTWVRCLTHWKPFRNVFSGSQNVFLDGRSPKFFRLRRFWSQSFKKRSHKKNPNRRGVAALRS